MAVFLFFVCFIPSAVHMHSVQKRSDNSVECKCVPQHLCGDNDVAVNGQGLIDVRLGNDECPNYFEICCEHPLTSEAVQQPTPISFKGCGYKNIVGVGPRITSNSANALFGELPWNVVILFRDILKSERNMYRCGGSLIHPQVVLTAAHCVRGTNPAHLIVRAGEWNTKSNEEPVPHQDMTVKEIVVHPEFHEGSLRNDIAMVFLSEALVMADNIGVICLPPQNLELENIMCYASGWGKDAFKKGKHSSILKKVDLPLVSKDNCLSALRKTRLGPFYSLHQSFICAGGMKNKDTCKGDGGSPLTCPIPGDKDRFFQMGIVSWGIGCGEDGTPGVYVNVPLYTDWIDQQLQSKNMDARFYKLENMYQ